MPSKPRPYRPSDVQRRALLVLGRCGDQGVTCSNLGSELATGKYRRLPQTYARQGGKTLHALEGRGLVSALFDKIHWNWCLTPRGLVERVKLSLVEGVFEASFNLPLSWTCAGPCGVVREAAANQLLDEGWFFTSVGPQNWGRCPRCRADVHPDVAAVARQLEESRARRV